MKPVKRRENGAHKQRARGDWRPEETHERYWRMEVGQDYHILTRGNPQPATCLAVIGAEAILEWESPSGRSALRKVPANYPFGTRAIGRPYKNMSYRNIPKIWLLAMAKNDVEWIGSPQQARDLRKTPRQLFLEKWPDDKWKLEGGTAGG